MGAHRRSNYGTGDDLARSIEPRIAEAAYDHGGPRPLGSSRKLSSMWGTVVAASYALSIAANPRMIDLTSTNVPCFCIALKEVVPLDLLKSQAFLHGRDELIDDAPFCPFCRLLSGAHLSCPSRSSISSVTSPSVSATRLRSRISLVSSIQRCSPSAIPASRGTS
jgi:hypothetical protein